MTLSVSGAKRLMTMWMRRGVKSSDCCVEGYRSPSAAVAVDDAEMAAAGGARSASIARLGCNHRRHRRNHPQLQPES